ncbi:hypothetical protein SAMN05216383_10478 [Prevotella sp. KH2C16]|nr:hypothetical protein SAMN05216383_10478 [Prevotella sp. KH2C16]
MRPLVVLTRDDCKTKKTRLPSLLDETPAICSENGRPEIPSWKLHIHLLLHIYSENGFPICRKRPFTLLLTAFYPPSNGLLPSKRPSFTPEQVIDRTKSRSPIYHKKQKIVLNAPTSPPFHNGGTIPPQPRLRAPYATCIIIHFRRCFHKKTFS